MSGELRVDVTRGGYVESVHRVAACVVDAAGRIVEEAGDVESPVFLRSAAKPFIAAAAVAAGVVERFGFEPHEIAVMAASHSGEPFHVAAVEAMLHKTGLDASALQCGLQEPYDERAAQALRAAGRRPTALQNNCSGKHAGILALSLLVGADPATYLCPEHPAQRRILDFCARMSDDDARSWPVAIDGCGIPVYATGLRHGALAFARLATLEGIAPEDARALAVVRAAMLRHPEYVAGTGQLDTLLMRAGGGAIVSKAGAEGVHGVAALGQGYGMAAKVLDGTARARAPATLALLRRLGVLDERQLAELAGFARPPVYNRAGTMVGEIVSGEGV